MRPTAARLRPGWAVVVVAAMVCASCGGSGSGIAPTVYAQRACGAVSAFETALTNSSRQLSIAVGNVKGSTPKVKIAVLDLLTAARDQAATLSSALDKAGIPRGSHGGDIAGGLRAAAAAAVATITSQQQVVSAASTTDSNAFFATLGTVSTALQAAADKISTAIEEVGNVGDDALNRAFAAENACASL